MIMYGTKGKTLKKYIPFEKECDFCHRFEHVALGTIRYFHIFWIPFFPIKKDIHMQCLHCKKVSGLDGLDRDERLQAKSQILSLKNTWGFYFILWVFALLMAFSAFSTIIGSAKI